MNILFIHRSFPAQYRYPALVLANNPNNKVVFITEEHSGEIPNVQKILYKANFKNSKNCHPCLIQYEKTVYIAQAVANVAINLKKEGFKPDVIFGFSAWGSAMFMKDVFPDVPLISYYEWFAHADGPESVFDGRVFNETDREKIRCSNSNLLVDLYSSDAGITPTYWQKDQFPHDFHSKIKVIHDGIDTGICKPDNSAKFFIKDKNLELSLNDEVITYGTRGMEPYRGFPQFMEAVEVLLKKRPKAHVVIAGDDAVCYGLKLPNDTYKNHMLKNLDLDMKRVHFTGSLPFLDYIKLLQISSAHIYLTYPYILSWSILNAMSTGCCVIASNTQPVLEVMKDNYNGLLVDFYDIGGIAEKIEYALDNRDKMQVIGRNARETILEKYEFKKCLIQQINFMINVIEKKGNRNKV